MSPMVMVPVRAAAPVFAVSEYATVPLPVPEAPPVMVIHGAFAVAVHDPAAVTDTVPLPAAADRFVDEAPKVTRLRPVGVTELEAGDGAVVPTLLIAATVQV